jgi:hypothetical protein
VGLSTWIHDGGASLLGWSRRWCPPSFLDIRHAAEARVGHDLAAERVEALRSSLRGRSRAPEPAELPAAAGGGGALQLVRAGGAGEAPFLPPLYPQARSAPTIALLGDGDEVAAASSASVPSWGAKVVWLRAVQVWGPRHHR